VRIAGTYSFKRGRQEVAKRYPRLLSEVNDVIGSVDASQCKIKRSKEKTMMGAMLYSPIAINTAFKRAFAIKGGWQPVRVQCTYSTEYYEHGYEARTTSAGAFREMDFVKEKLGIEVQFGKYAFMVYNVCAKMTIFSNLGHIDCGVEIVPVKALAEQMSSGVSYYEQFVWDLDQRGTADIDIPVLIIGIDDDR
jgi:hypothetical protein